MDNFSDAGLIDSQRKHHRTDCTAISLVADAPKQYSNDEAIALKPGQKTFIKKCIFGYLAFLLFLTDDCEAYGFPPSLFMEWTNYGCT